eukprot:gene16736-22192_t
MLARLLAPFEFGLGGRLGSGRQWMSWIHRDDLVRLIVHAIARPDIAGPLNATAPAPVTNARFTAALGRALHRPAILPVPTAPLHRLLGAFADELLLGGQRVLPAAALASGFRFVYPTIDAALGAIVGNRRLIPTAARPIPATLAKQRLVGEVRALFNDQDRGEKPVARREDGLFGQQSVVWRVHGDVTSMMVGGVTALLLQMLHPAVLAGVWDHSNFRTDMIGRLRRTARFIALTSYGGRDDALAVIARVREVHDHVRGT